MHNQWIVFGGMGVIALSAIGGSLCSANLGNTSGSSNVRNQRILETNTPEASPAPSASPGTSPSPGASPAATLPAVKRTYSAPPEMQIDPNKQYFATIKTDKGDIQLELYPKDAPQAVNNFVFLARNDFYDGLTFHRVIEGFVAQGGDPAGTGAGGPGYFLSPERNTLKHEVGSIAMARSPQGVSGSQFYIALTPQPGLDAQGFTVFGKVVSGLDVLQQITKRDPAVNPRAAPGDRIQDISIEER